MVEKEIIRQIDRYLNGELSVSEADRLWEEMLRNPEYLQLLEAEVVARDYFDQSEGEDLPAVEEVEEKVKESKKRSDSLFFGPAGWVAGSTAALILFLIIYFCFVPSRAQQMAPGLLSEIPPEKMATTDLHRRGDVDYHQLDVDINRGFEAAISGRSSESEQLFRDILTSEPGELQRAVAHLNYGILLYNRSSFEEASRQFDLVTQVSGASVPTHITGKGWWFLAQSLTRLEAYPSAHRALQRAMEFNGTYKKESDQLLTFLESKIDRETTPGRR